MSKHTPGPWMAVDNFDFKSREREKLIMQEGRNGVCIAKVIRPFAMSEEEYLANVERIVSAGSTSDAKTLIERIVELGTSGSLSNDYSIDGDGIDVWQTDELQRLLLDCREYLKTIKK